MESKISVAELAKDLAAILERVRAKGDRYVVESDGEPVARIEPVNGLPGITVGEFFDLLGSIGLPDAAFADDLEAIQAEQSMAEFPEWPS